MGRMRKHANNNTQTRDANDTDQKYKLDNTLEAKETRELRGKREGQR